MKDFIRKIHDFLRLKRVIRTGWGYYGYGPRETVASHTFGTAILTLFIVREVEKSGVKLDLLKALIMALIHEVGETRLGDLHLEARRFLGEEYVSEAEQKVAKAVLKDDYLEAIFEEFEKGQSIEARLVRAIDKLELLIEAKERAKPNADRIVDILISSKNRKFMNEFPIIQELIDSLTGD